jgi:hypothetical protein
MKKTNKQTYSSKMVKQLLTSEVFTFWSKDWTKKISVDWNVRIPLKAFETDVIERVGEEFGYERSVNAAVGLEAATYKIVGNKKSAKLVKA